MSIKRKLTLKEIKNILNDIPSQKGIPSDASIANYNNNIKLIREQLENIEIYPENLFLLKQNTIHDFETSLIQPGENVGILTAQSIGEKQTQLSVGYNEKINIKYLQLVNNNYQEIIKKITIGEFIDNELLYNSIHIGNDSYIKPMKNVQILTLSQSEKIEWKHISEISRHLPHGNLILVNTQSGRSVLTTLSHSHLTKYYDKIIPIPGSKLKIGDRIPVYKKNVSKYDILNSYLPFYISRDILYISFKLKLHTIYDKFYIYFINQKDIRRAILLDLIPLFEYKAEELKINIDDKIKILYDAYHSDIIWDKITNLTLVLSITYNKKYKYVYDFSVPGNETFVLDSGIVVHNTLNSVDWSEQILYSKNDQVFVKPIGEMIDKLLEENKNNIKLFPENKTEYLDLPDGYLIPSGDSNGYNKWRKIQAITRHLPNGQLVKVTTHSGRTVMASQSKSFLVWNGTEFIPTLGSDVKIGDILPTTKYMPKHKIEQEFLDLSTIFPKNEYLYSSEIVKARELKAKTKFWYSKHNGIDFITPYNRGDCLFGKRKDFFMKVEPGFIYIHTSNAFVSHLPDKIPLDEDFGFLCGIYLAEGCVTLTFMCISNNDPVIRKRVTDWCDKYGITYHLVISQHTKKTQINGTSYDLKIHSTLLARLFKIICDTGSLNKFIPFFSYTASMTFIKGLIDGYFSGDGCVNKKDGSISVSSVSKTLIIGISFLLSYFNIFGSILVHNIVNDPRGIIKNKKIPYNLSIRNEFAQNFAKHIILTEPNKQNKLINVTLQKNYKYINGRNQEKFPSDRNVYFDEIKNIEIVESTKGVVYDFTVEETKNFNLFNGLILRDTFHKAGSGEKGVTQGVPRFSELLMATKSPKNVNCFIYFKENNNSIEEIRDMIGNTLVEITFKSITKSYEICINKEKEKWYKVFEILYQKDFEKYTDCLSIELNMNILYEYKIKLEDIANNIEKLYHDIICIWSPEEFGKLDIFVDTSSIELPENRQSIIDVNEIKNVYLEEVVQPNIENIHICGINGIKHIFFNRDNFYQNNLISGEPVPEGPRKEEEKKIKWMIETNGSNLKALFAHSNIDMSRTISNNVWDIYSTLGIEAARQFLIDEFAEILEGINTCHAQLLVDRMTYMGTIASISRYTMRASECGPLSKMTFEESLDNICRAGIFGQIETTNGVSASIICGKIARIGTGLCDLKIDVNKLLKNTLVSEVKENEINNNTDHSFKKDVIDTGNDCEHW
jgi:DNA-directed RNA polymerase beta' subunit